MKQLFDSVSHKTSRLVTQTYSTSFSLGIYCLNKRFHTPVYDIYGFVRLADEIVDSFHDYDKETLLLEFEKETYLSIERGISLNPVLNSFQKVVRDYHIPHELIDSFIRSMRYDLTRKVYDKDAYEQYIYGSAEVVGLMCLKVFTENDNELYEQLKPQAKKLGAAFQKINFLRDIKADNEYLERTYFPGVNLNGMTCADKKKIEKDIQADMDEALRGIKKLPRGTRFGVYVAYVYYKNLFAKIKAISSERVMMERIRISNYRKLYLLFSSYCRHGLNLI
jgi:phytoene/squalene synthetase